MKAGTIQPPLSFYWRCNSFRTIHNTIQMKPLEQLTNVERAELLFDLFKDEIPGFLKFTKNTVVVLLEQEAEHRRKWENKLFTFDLWLSLASCIEEKISRFGKSMERSRFIFSEQLFDGYHDLFMSIPPANHIFSIIFYGIRFA